MKFSLLWLAPVWRGHTKLEPARPLTASIQGSGIFMTRYIFHKAK